MSSDVPTSIRTPPYSLTFDEFVRGYRPFNKSVTSKALISVAVTWAITLSICGWLTRGSAVQSPIMWAVLGFSLLFILRTPSRMRRQFRLIYDDQFGNEIAQTTFNESGVAVRSDSASTEIRWRGFTHFMADNDFLILYRTHRIPITFPRRVFASPEDFWTATAMAARFIEYLSERRGFSLVPEAELADAEDFPSERSKSDV